MVGHSSCWRLLTHPPAGDHTTTVRQQPFPPVVPINLSTPRREHCQETGLSRNCSATMVVIPVLVGSTQKAPALSDRLASGAHQQRNCARNRRPRLVRR